MVDSQRIRREKATVGIMIEMYCRAHHGSALGVCARCQTLHEHSLRKIERCRFGAAKPVCARCRIHCYGKDMRNQIRAVMRFAGPRMMFRHPLLALLHAMDRHVKGTPS